MQAKTANEKKDQLCVFGWLCEEYTKTILDKFTENGLASLPLPPELSREIWEGLDTGEKTALYDTIENKLV